MQITSGIQLRTLRVLTQTMTQILIELSSTEFLVTLQVPYDQVPLVMTLNFNEDQVFGVGTPFQLVNTTPIDAVPGIGNQEASGTFTVIPKVLLKPGVVVSATTIGLDESTYCDINV